MIILCCGCSCGLFLEKNWVVVGVVVSYCTKIGLMLLLGCVIQSNCGCGCGCSLQVDCVVVVVVVDHFSFCTSLAESGFLNKGNQYLSSESIYLFKVFKIDMVQINIFVEYV